MKEKSVWFKSGKYNLAGVMHIPSRGKKPCPCVVMFHGFTGTKVETHGIFTKTARALAEKGIGTFRFDFMGTGDSEGSFEKMTLDTRLNDAKKALDFLLKSPAIDKKRFGILGFSMGAITAAFIARQYKSRSLALWAPLAYPSDIRDIMLTEGLEKKLDAVGKIYPPGFGNYLGKDFFHSLSGANPLEFSGLYGGNVLLVHSRDDKTVPLSHSLEYFKAFHNKAVLPRILVLDEGGHTFSTEFSEKQIIEETVDFFNETLV